MEETPQHSPRLLTEIHSIFPIDVVPDRLRIDESKVEIQLRQFLVAETHNLLINDISDADLQTGPISATLKIIPHAINGDPITISNLQLDEAKQAQQIILGLMIAEERNLDLSAIPDPELVQKVISLAASSALGAENAPN